MTKRKLTRSSKTGKIVTQEYAKANPDTTVTETMGDYKKRITSARSYIKHLQGVLDEVDRILGDVK